MNIARLIFLSLLSVLLGAVFIYSSFTKTLPIQTFEYTMVEFVAMPWWLAAFSARLLVGLEAGLGVLILLNLYGKNKWVLKFSLIILIVFSIYLIYLWATVGNDVNCGCFGDAVWMSPSSSLLKNVLMGLVLIILIKLHTGIDGKIANILSILTIIGFTAYPFYFFSIPDAQPAFLNKEKYEIDLSPLYDTGRIDIPKIQLNNGKHIVAFMSLTCPHCKLAAYKMKLMQESNPNLPFFLVLNGDSTNLKPFWDKTKAESIPHTMLLGSDFIQLSGLRLPAIYWINDGWVENSSNYINLTQEAIEEWIHE